MNHKNDLYTTARIISNKLNLKVVTFSWGYNKEKLADKTVKFANPGDFLSLIYYADYVITNSFHGTAFSINLNKQFSVYMPSGFGTRIDSILSLCKLQNRLVSKKFDLQVLSEPINYDCVNTVLEGERSKALNFLKRALS